MRIMILKAQERKQKIPEWLMLDSLAANASGKCSSDGRMRALPRVTVDVPEALAREWSHSAHMWPLALPSSGSLTMKG